MNFKKEKLWILRLAYAGLNIDDDAQIYIRNSIIETLLSFYSSSLADIESKELILQVISISLLITHVCPVTGESQYKTTRNLQNWKDSRYCRSGVFLFLLWVLHI